MEQNYFYMHLLYIFYTKRKLFTRHIPRDAPIPTNSIPILGLELVGIGWNWNWNWSELVEIGLKSVMNWL